MARVLLLSLAVVLASTSAAHAQGRSSLSLAEDTTAARLAAVGIIRELSGALARTIFDTTTHPMTIQVPDSTSRAWNELAAGLFSMLNGRAPTPQDTSVTELTIQPVAMRGDTMFIGFNFRARRICPDPGRMGGHLAGYQIRVLRRGPRWWEHLPPGPTVLGNSPC